MEKVCWPLAQMFKVLVLWTTYNNSFLNHNITEQIPGASFKIVLLTFSSEVCHLVTFFCMAEHCEVSLSLRNCVSLDLVF